MKKNINQAAAQCSTYKVLLETTMVCNTSEQNFKAIPY